MTTVGKMASQNSTLQGSDDMTIGGLLCFLDAVSGKPLVFHYGGNAIRPGYHVTEVKAGRFDALDCGANPESWSEIFVQLWDVDEEGRTYMAAGKFSAIIRKVSGHVSLEPEARLTFEVSDGIQPMRLHHASQPQIVDGTIHIELSPRAASCKPRDRWLRDQENAASCCGPSAAEACCA